MMPIQKIGKLSLAVLAINMATGCSDDDENNSFTPTANTAVVQTVLSPDSSDIQMVGLDGEEITVSPGQVPSDQTDYIVRGYGEDFYHIGRFQIDTMTRRNASEPAVVEAEFSMLDDVEDDPANVQDMVFVNAEKAYLIRLGDDKIWIVNPQAETASEFKLGELDLSDYADADGTPEASSGIIVDGKLFVAMQRLDRTDGWNPAVEGVPAYVAVFDTNTDTEIDTNPNDADDALKGIALPTRNPGSFDYHPAVGLLLQSVGDIFSSTRPQQYIGGIVKIDTNNYGTTLLVDDGTDEEGGHPYGGIYNLAIQNAESAYFVGYEGWQNTTVYHFNPQTGEVSGAIEATKNKDISLLARSPKENLWIGFSEEGNSRIVIYKSKDEVMDQISLALNPRDVAFVNIEEDEEESAE